MNNVILLNTTLMPPKTKLVIKPTAIDLFAGCGGMSKGFTNAGIDVLAGIDVWKTAVASYEKNFDHFAVCRDLTQFSPEQFAEEYNIHKSSVDIITGGPPCFIAGTKVLTNTGYKNIETIELNDTLMTHTGKFQKILNLQQKTYSGCMYNFTINYHSSTITCTDEHPFYVRTGSALTKLIEKPIWKPANKITKNDYFGMVINTNNLLPKFSHSYFDNINCWFEMGYFLKNKQFAQKSTEINDILSNLFREQLIPEWVQSAPCSYIQSFINGYTTTNTVITTTSINLALEFQRLYLKLGYIVSIHALTNTNTYTLVRVSCLNKTKNPVAFIDNGYAWFSLVAINTQNVKNTIVYNFEVQSDNSYIVENVIAHNCQSFSMAGKRDKDDPRNSLFMEFVKYINYFLPKAFIMENVMGILSKKTAAGENVIDIIMHHLTKNHECIVCKLYASDFGVPQNRRRVIIIGIRKDLGILPTEPLPLYEPSERPPVKSVLLPRNEVDGSYFLSERALQGIRNKRERSRAEGKGFGAQFLDPEKPSFTISARYWKDGCDALVRYSDTEIRRLTVIELKRIQSFPDDYVISGSKKEITMQIGNAVAVNFAKHLGEHIKKLLEPQQHLFG